MRGLQLGYDVDFGYRQRQRQEWGLLEDPQFYDREAVVPRSG